MHFGLDEDQQAFAGAVRDFARSELKPSAVELAHAPGYAWDVAKQLAKNDLLGLTLREEDGGQGASLMDAVIAIQEVAYASPKAADIVQAGSFGAIRTLAEYATKEQKERFLPGLLSGEKLISLAMSESEAGSAVTELRTTAVQDGDEYVIDGAKIYGTHSPEATLYLVYVRFGPGTSNIGSVLVERDTPGLTVGAKHEYMSGEEWSELVLRRLPHPGRERAAGAGWLQEADLRLQRRADRQLRARSGARALRVRGGA